MFQISSYIFFKKLSRPDTPLLWIYSSDEKFGSAKKWMEDQDALKIFSNEIEEAMNNDGVNQVMRAPAPFFNRYLERMFGDEFEEELLAAFGVSEDAINNHKEIGRFITSYATVGFALI